MLTSRTIKAKCICIQVFLSVFAVTGIDTTSSQTIPRPPTQTNDWFGKSVSIYENVAFVGAPLNDRGGAAYVFEKLNGKWTQKDKLFPNDDGGYFGWSVSIYKQYALVSSSLPCSVYAFEMIEGKWTQTDKLTSPTSSDQFGNKISIYNEYALISASYDDEKGFNVGAAYIFERGTDRKWQKRRKLMPDDAYPRLLFGNTLSLHGEQAVIGTSEAGAYIFEKVQSTWTQTAALKHNVPISVSIYSDCALIGSPNDDSKKGVVYIYRKSNGKWDQTPAKLGTQDAERQSFGQKVVLADGIALIGSPQYVYVFENDQVTNTWKQTTKLPITVTEYDISIYKYDAMIGRSNAALEYYDVTPPKPPLQLSCWDGQQAGYYKDAPITFTAHFPAACDGGSLRFDTRRDGFVTITEIKFGDITTQNSVTGLYDSMRSGETTLTIAADQGTDGMFYTKMECYDNKGAKCTMSEMVGDTYGVPTLISKYYNFILVNIMVSVLITLCMLCMVYYCCLGDKKIKYKRVIQQEV